MPAGPSISGAQIEYALACAAAPKQAANVVAILSNIPASFILVLFRAHLVSTIQLRCNLQKHLFG